MRTGKLSVLLTLGARAFFSCGTTAYVAQDKLAAFRNNSCVNCHSQLSEPLGVSAHYFEWHKSKYREKGVGGENAVVG